MSLKKSIFSFGVSMTAVLSFSLIYSSSALAAGMMIHELQNNNLGNAVARGPFSNIVSCEFSRLLNMKLDRKVNGCVKDKGHYYFRIENARFFLVM
jgi:hypothetical protein